MSKYKSYLITHKMIAKAKACSAGLRWFKRRFPKGFKVSNCTEEMVIRLSNIGNFYDSLWVLDLLLDLRDESTECLPLSNECRYDLENIAYLLSDTPKEFWK